MPTGYTAPIEDDEDFTFRQYALRCARGIGYFIHQRDQTLDTLPSPDIESSYYETSLVEARRDLAEMTMRGERQWREEHAEGEKEDEARYAALKARDREKRERYEAMRARVVAWVLPTEEHGGLKELMLSQIDMCLPHYKEDQRFDYRPRKVTWQEYREGRLKSARESVTYYEEKLAKEREVNRRARAYLEALLASLPGE